VANPRQLDKRRKSIRNIRKITRTMELIATARFKKAMDRAHAATAYTEKINQVVRDLAQSGLKVQHPLLQSSGKKDSAYLLVLTSNRGLCGGYNGSVLRETIPKYRELSAEYESLQLEVSGRRGISAMKFRGFDATHTFTQFEDQPKYDDVAEIANRYLAEYAAGRMDRLDVAYTRFVSPTKQEAVVETLLPLTSPSGDSDASASGGSSSIYEFLPSAESILEEVVPTSFRVKLFKCFLDAAVSEQIARRIAMKAATENAGELIKSLSMEYNRARQSRITNELMDIIGGVEALGD
jgi:F-type H+-transporting ATPase subunit gamma